MEQHCEKCGTSWNSDEPIQCPTCQDSKAELSGTLHLVDSKVYRFAPENYKVTWWDKLTNWFWRWWHLI